MAGDELLAAGSYSALLSSSPPLELRPYYDPRGHTVEWSDDAFHGAIPRGFAWEKFAVCSAPADHHLRVPAMGYIDCPYKSMC